MVILGANPLNERPKLLWNLREILSYIKVCQCDALPPSRFRVALSKEDDAFNTVVCLDPMKVNLRRVLRVFDKETKFGATQSLLKESMSDVWNAFDVIRVQTYVSTPDSRY